LRDAAADFGHQPSGDLGSFRLPQDWGRRAAESGLGAIRGEPVGCFADDPQGREIAGFGRIAPGEQAVAAEDDTGISRMVLRQLPELQAEVEARPLPAEKRKVVSWVSEGDPWISTR